MMGESARDAPTGAAKHENRDKVAENLMRESQVSLFMADPCRSELFFEVPYIRIAAIGVVLPNSEQG
jgi:hypothetical protein